LVGDEFATVALFAGVAVFIGLVAWLYRYTARSADSLP